MEKYNNEFYYDEENLYWDEGYPLDPLLPTNLEFDEDWEEEFTALPDREVARNYQPQKSIAKDFDKKETFKPLIPNIYPSMTKNKNYNLYSYIYVHWLYATCYMQENYEYAEIILPTSRIYSWVGCLMSYLKKNHLYGFQIENVDKDNSKLIYQFNPNKIMYEKYINAVTYLIDNGRFQQ